MTEKTISLTIAPTKDVLNVDKDLVNFVKNRMKEQELIISTGKEFSVSVLHYKINFIVKSCNPENSTIDENTTKLTILPYDTRKDMRLPETRLNIFMDDERAKKVLSDLIVNEIITEENAVSIWKEFKKYQSKSLEC